MRIVIYNEPINKYTVDNRIECEYVDLPKMRAALFVLSLQLDGFIDKDNRPDSWIAKETAKLLDEAWNNLMHEEVKS